MFSKKIQDALNQQINSELYSAYLYLAMSAYFESLNFPGQAKWMRTQNDEERAHAMKIFEFVTDRGGRVVLDAIAKPATDFESPLAVWEQVLAHEQKVTASIDKLYELAVAEKDYATQTMLAWFINEQVEEEKNATQIVEQIRQVSKNPAFLVMFDGHFTKRAE